VIWGEAVSREGISAVGTAVAAEAPLASDKDTPTTPTAGMTSFRRFSFEVCFVCDTVKSSGFCTRRIGLTRLAICNVFLAASQGLNPFIMNRKIEKLTYLTETDL
jgi:hypothetical protein